MPFDPSALPPAFFGGSVILGVIATAFALVRVTRRRVRRSDRRRWRLLALQISGFLDGRVTARELRRAAQSADAPTFWTALEAISLPLRHREWKSLSAALERNRHDAAERRALINDSPWRRELAARRLGLVCSARSRRALRRALERGPESVTYAAALSLARARDAKALGWVLDHPEMLHSRSAPVRVTLFRAFGRGALPVLVRRLDSGVGDSRLECAILETLGLARHRVATTIVAARMSSPDLDARVVAARALGRLEATDQADVLLGALEDEAWQVRAQAARALGRAHVVWAAPALAERLTDRSWWVRRHSAYALGVLGDEGIAALRRTVATSPDRYARDIALEVLEGGYSASA